MHDACQGELVAHRGSLADAGADVDYVAGAAEVVNIGRPRIGADRQRLATAASDEDVLAAVGGHGLFD